MLQRPIQDLSEFRVEVAMPAMRTTRNLLRYAAYSIAYRYLELIEWYTPRGCAQQLHFGEQCWKGGSPVQREGRSLGAGSER